MHLRYGDGAGNTVSSVFSLIRMR